MPSRTQTATRYDEFAAVAVHVQVLLVVQSRVTNQFEPSYTHHLYCCGALPPVMVAVNVIDVPVGCGADRSAVREVSAMGPAGTEDVTVNVSVRVLPTASRAVTVMMFVPDIKPIDETLQLVRPDAVPLPPRSFTQVTCVTPTSSDADPLR